MNTQRPPRRGSLPSTGEPAASGAEREPKVKGVAFRSVLAVLGSMRGELFVDRALGTLPPDQAQMLRYTVVNTGWYPIDLYRALWGAILGPSPASYDLARTIGAAAIRRDVGGVYRVLFKVLSIESLVSLSAKLFPYYYDTGTLTNQRVSPGLIRSVYEGCIGFDRAMWEELAGSCEALIQLAGGKNVRVTITRGGTDYSTACIMNIEWR